MKGGSLDSLVSDKGMSEPDKDVGSDKGDLEDAMNDFMEALADKDAPAAAAAFRRAHEICASYDENLYGGGGAGEGDEAENEG